MNAEFSECGLYRYTLTRTLPRARWAKPVLFIMLNPSTADATKDDPTIRRCISFADEHECTKLVVVNLFALRSTDPKALKDHHNPIGPLNDEKISQMVFRTRADNGIIVAAWGAHTFAKERADQVTEKIGHLYCLGRTKSGAPRHPLYVPRGTYLESL